MTTLTTPLHIVYTAPGSPDIGQQIASAPLDGPTATLQAVCKTEFIVHYPPEQTLRLQQPVLPSYVADQTLVVTLPADEVLLDLVFVAEPSGTATRVPVTTKKEGSKPDLPRTAAFRP